MNSRLVNPLLLVFVVLDKLLNTGFASVSSSAWRLEYFNMDRCESWDGGPRFTILALTQRLEDYKFEASLVIPVTLKQIKSETLIRSLGALV